MGKNGKSCGCGDSPAEQMAAVEPVPAAIEIKAGQGQMTRIGNRIFVDGRAFPELSRSPLLASANPHADVTATSTPLEANRSNPVTVDIRSPFAEPTGTQQGSRPIANPLPGVQRLRSRPMFLTDLNVPLAGALSGAARSTFMGEMVVHVASGAMALSEIGLVQMQAKPEEKDDLEKWAEEILPPPPIPPVPPPGFPILPGSVDEWDRRLKEFAKRSEEWGAEVKRIRELIRTHHESDAKVWDTGRKPRNEPAQGPGRYTPPPAIYPPTDCPQRYFSKAEVQDTLRLQEPKVARVRWTQAMQANWEDTGDPYTSATPPPTQEELKRRYKGVSPKPGVNAVQAAVKGFLALLANSAAVINAGGLLPEGLEQALQDMAERVAGQCPPQCPNRAVSLTGWDIEFFCWTRELFDFSLGLDGVWTAIVTVELWCRYKGTLYIDVLCTNAASA